MQRTIIITALALVAGCGNNTLQPAGGDQSSVGDQSSTGDMSTMADLNAPQHVGPQYTDPQGNVLISCDPGQYVCLSLDIPDGSSDTDMWAGMAMCGTQCPTRPDGGNDRYGPFTIQCDGPEDCSGNPCCITATDIGTKPTFGDVLCTNAPNACPPQYNQGKGATSETRVCHVDADCSAGLSSSILPDCCTGTFHGVTAHFCFNKMYAAFLAGVTCP